MKALIDRAGFVSFANGHLFKNKVGTPRSPYDVPVPAARRIPCSTSSLEAR